MKELTAKDVMTREVLAVGADWPLERLADFPVENSISGAPVTSEDGRLLGVVSVTDIVRHTSLLLRISMSFQESRRWMILASSVKYKFPTSRPG